MSASIVLPTGHEVRVAGIADQPTTDRPDWGLFADECWDGWGEVLNWPDFGVPLSDEDAIAGIGQAWGRIHQGEDVLVGCLGGAGRTGTLLACLAVLSGVPPDCALGWTQRTYPRAKEMNSNQQSWVTDYFARNDWVNGVAADSRTTRIKGHTRRVREGAVSARQRPEQAPVLVWAVEDVLAVSQRPLRDHPKFGGSRSPFPASAAAALQEWVDRTVGAGIRSVVVLTSDSELAYYDAATATDGGLLGLYVHRGLRVAHFPADDPAHDLTAAAAFYEGVDKLASRVVGALRELPLPALMHCSAASDRSPPVAARVAVAIEDCGLH